MKRLILLALALASASVFGQSFNGAGGSIPDFDTSGFSTTIDVNQPVGNLLSVTFTGLNHTWIGDLTFTLRDPSNNSVIIMQQPGVGPNSTFGNSSDFLAINNYGFEPGAPTIWTSAVTVPSGMYGTSSNSNGVEVPTNFAGVGGQGLWTFSAFDSASGDTGSFTTVTLNFAPVPEPTTMAALGLGALALLRRRRKQA